MKIRNLISCALCGLTLFACSPSGGGKDREMDRFITDLMDRMTLREKLGQLNLPSGGDLVTGSVMNGELSDMIRKQEIGGFFNVKGIQKINALQHLAVEESRLKIPLLVGADVIHGYETIFPIPLALSIQNSRIPFKLQFPLAISSSSSTLVNCRELCMTILSALSGTKI